MKYSLLLCAAVCVAGLAGTLEIGSQQIPSTVPFCH